MPASRTRPPAATAVPPPRVVFSLLTLVLLAGACLLTYATHEVYEAVTEGDGIAALDHPALREAFAVRSPASTSIATALTFLGGRIGNPLIALVVLVLACWRRRDAEPAMLLVPALLGSLVVTIVGKRLIGRVRPPRELALPPFETSPSFPSGHTLNATVLAVIAGYIALRMIRSRWGRATTVAGCALSALGVGLSRVYLGQHWLTDVIAGMLIGIAWALSVIAAYRVHLALRRRRADEAAIGAEAEARVETETETA